MRNGTLIRMTSEESINRAAGSRAADEARRRRWIDSIDVTGGTAVARIVLDYPTVRFTDYMSLSRIDGRWVIINKMFQAEPKTPAT